MLSNMQAPSRKLTVQTCRKTCVYPYRFDQGKFIGGFCAEQVVDNARMPGALEPRDVPLAVASPPRHHYEGRYLYAGPLWNHFGHVLVDCIHRLWAVLENPDRYVGIVFSNVQNLRPSDTPRVPSFVPALFDLMGLPSLPTILVDEASLFETLDVPQLGSVYKIGLSPAYEPYLQRYQETISQKTSLFKGKTPARIFYGRSHALRDGGVIGSTFFEKMLAHAGFSSCIPEELSLRFQFAHVLQAEEIVFEEGSSIHITELLLSVAANVRMLPRRPNPHVFRKALDPRCPSFFVLAKGENVALLPDRNGKMSPASLTFYKDGRTVYAGLEQAFNLPTFDQKLYHTTELEDLRSAPAKNAALTQSRNLILQTYR